MLLLHARWLEPQAAFNGCTFEAILFVHPIRFLLHKACSPANVDVGLMSHALALALPRHAQTLPIAVRSNANVKYVT